MPCESSSRKSGKIDESYRTYEPMYLVGLPPPQEQHARDKVFSGDTLLLYECILEPF